jgi:hypothetical protein
VKTLHWDMGWIARTMFRTLANGEKLLTGYENFQAFLDMEDLGENGTYYLEGYKLFPYLAAHYPDAVFILNTRNCEDWIQSRFRHWRGAYAAQHKYLYRVKSDEEIANIWRTEWERHHNRVIDFFSTTAHRFFVCNIETDLPRVLDEQLPECNLDPSRYKLYKDPEKNSLFAGYRNLLRLYTRKFERKANIRISPHQR